MGSLATNLTAGLSNTLLSISFRKHFLVEKTIAHDCLIEETDRQVKPNPPVVPLFSPVYPGLLMIVVEDIACQIMPYP